MSFVAVVHDDHLTFNGVDYFRDGAGSVLLGAYGEKKASAAGSEHLVVRGRLPAPRLAVRSTAAVTIDFDRSRLGGDEQDALRSGARRLVALEMLLPDVKIAVNGTPLALRNLKSYGWEARVAHQVVVMLEAPLAEALARATGLEFAGDDGADALTVRVRGATMELPGAATFAYLMCRPGWNSSRTAAERFIDDPWGVE